jgi:hypothetical protein
MKLKSLLIYLVLLLSCANTFVQAQALFKPGQKWLDTDGNTIEAHGGGILKVGEIYYWYGENHALGEGNKTGISCYSSTDLFNWKNEGVVFPKEALPEMFRDSGVCERPKVLYNAKTRKYVMWMHLDANHYTTAMAGVAVADSPTGKFSFLKAKRPVFYDYGYKLDRVQGIDPKEKELGNGFRDMALFQDDDNKAYLIYSSEELATLYVVLLNDDFTDILYPSIKGKTWDRILINTYSEAPAPFKYKNKYYLVASGTSGWDPNPAKLAVAETIFGPWKLLGNPCVGIDSETTFRSQSTYILPAPGKPADNFIYMGDRWNGKELEKSTYVWLPFRMNEYGSFKLAFLDKWDLSVFDESKSGLNPPEIKESVDCNITWKSVAGAHAYKVFKNGHLVTITKDTHYEIPPEFGGLIFNYSVVSWTISGQMSKASNGITKSWEKAETVYLSDMFPESSSQGWGTLQKDRSIQLRVLDIAGREFRKGLGTHAPAETVYRICGNYSKFSSWIGVDNYPKFSNEPSVRFEVWGDNELLFQSKIMKVQDEAQKVELDITGISELKLIVNDAGDGQNWDHADWAEAKVE